ncbi:arginase family protein [Bradyrhizobium diazoefficiens]|uniref:arginase family protein n=1 Tax=Bradyrhizobium diazoefficiens TaxID=1355477 RepID=UPI00190A332F|nr:arginase family protein [Bradyrhizobium diazoefficiens]
MGGDDSAPIPLLEAFHETNNLTVSQIDAHLDWCDHRNGSRYTFSSAMRASEMQSEKRIVGCVFGCAPIRVRVFGRRSDAFLRFDRATAKVEPFRRRPCVRR